ncbi:aminodeoxychorismate/anthranilate synthase component II [Neisseria sp. CCUG12390]|uniref:aminodeoxychorismate/anthranilate synthase component II n=1 Tax=Neisseria sp. CCUG12390 TaxID=3392035 RepID=UPI003A1033A1
MLLFIDNYDSFTYNIVQYFAELDQEVVVRRNDDITLDGIAALKPQYLVIGPGPCSPKEAGISVAAMQHFAGKLPIMGVCLGHQTIGEAFGGNIVRAQTLMHGKVSPVHHKGTGMFKGLPNPVTCTRYHSLVINRHTLPDCLEVTAWTDDSEIMGVRHKDYPIEGVQFHPEALLTEHGHDMLRNFLEEFKTFSTTNAESR